MEQRGGTLDLPKILSESPAKNLHKTYETVCGVEGIVRLWYFVKQKQ
jgi:hypothetical protein